MEIKYTSDGKKVAVLGQLNDKQSIVQEVFVVNEQEIPSGENFVVSSLHDGPAISWKEKKLLELEERYERERKSWDSQISNLNKTMREQTDKIKDFVKQYKLTLADTDIPKGFDTALKLMSGHFKYVVLYNYGRYDVQLFEDALKSKDSFNNGLKLLTLFGKSDGDLNFRINRYSDGSGSNEDIEFFETEDECIEYIREKVKDSIDQSSKLYSSIVQMATNYDVELPEDMLKEYFDKEVDYANKQLDKKKDELKKAKDDLKEAKSMKLKKNLKKSKK